MKTTALPLYTASRLRGLGRPGWLPTPAPLQGLRITIPGLTHHNSESGLYGKFRIPNKLKLLPYSLATFRQPVSVHYLREIMNRHRLSSRAAVVDEAIHGPDPRTPEEFARDYQAPLEAVLEALDYVAQNRPLIELERDREAAKLRRGFDGPAGMRLLLDENMSDRRLGARLRAQGHDPVLATGVGLLSATDARVFIAAITQALPVLTRDSEDFTDLHDLIMAAGGHHSGVLVVRDPEQVRKLAGWGLTQDGNTFRIIDQLADALGTEVQPPFGPREHCHRMPRFRCTGAPPSTLAHYQTGRCRYRWSPCGRHARDRRPCSALAIREQSTVWMSSGTERPIDSCARIAHLGVYCLLRGPRAEIRPSSVFPNSAVGDSFASGARSALSLTPVVGRLGRNRGEWRGKSGQMLSWVALVALFDCSCSRASFQGNHQYHAYRHRFFLWKPKWPWVKTKPSKPAKPPQASTTV